MVMDDINAGAQLLSLLRQHRYLYHQLKLLADRERQSDQIDSPEMLLEVIFGRRKLVEKIHLLNEKMQPIKTNLQKLSSRIGPEYKNKAQETANQVQEIIEQILESTSSETAQQLPLYRDFNFNEFFAEMQF